MFRASVFQFFLFVNLLLCSSLRAELPVDSILNPKDYGKGYVSNADQVISGNTVTRLNALLTKLDQQKKAEVAVVLVNSIGDAVPKDFANKLFRTWKIGDRNTNNGLLILLIKDQRRVEFEVGYGLEGVLPDMISSRIQQQEMIPKLKNGDYDGAVLSGVEKVAARLLASKEELLQHNASLSNEKPVYPLKVLFQDFLVLIAYIAIYTIYVCSPAGERVLHNTSCWWGIFLLFGPAVIITLLAVFTNLYLNYLVVIAILYCCCCICMSVYFSGEIIYALKAKDKPRAEIYDGLKLRMKDFLYYAFLFPLPLLIIQFIRLKIKLHRLRYVPYYSEKCKVNMKLVRKEEMNGLSDAEKIENRLGAVSYDVWRAENCDDLLKVKYLNQGSGIVKCDSCGNMTGKVLRSTMEKKATSRAEGLRLNEYECQFCKAKFNRNMAIRKRSFSIAIGSGSGSSRSGSSGSSGDSGSSGSWAGGSSGGGGSGSNW